MTYRKQFPLFFCTALMLACTQSANIYENLLAEHEAREGSNETHYAVQEAAAKEYIASLAKR